MLRRWMREGCLVQINAGSLRGHFGQGAAQAARQFLNLNLVSVIASDTHDPIRRTPDLAWIRDFMELHYGAVYARAVLELHRGQLWRTRRCLVMHRKEKVRTRLCKGLVFVYNTVKEARRGRPWWPYV